MTKKSEKIEKNFHANEKKMMPLFSRIQEACDGLIYISETDAPVTAFDGGVVEGDVGSGPILQQIGREPNESIREVGFAKFFVRLTTIKDWHGAREKARTKKFLDLQKLIEENLVEPKVFKIGDIRIRIYAVGLDSEGRLMGIRTEAVET